MADVRSLLKNEHASRRIQHKHASYLTTGTLLCTVCHLRLKSETLWEGHLRSAGHLMRSQKVQDQKTEESQPSEKTRAPPISSKKRKASEEDEDGTIRKRSRAANGLPEGFFDAGQEDNTLATFPTEMKIPSRPATPLKPPEAIAVPRPELQVDEGEWAAFESDIATAEAQVTAANDAIISAPAMSNADIERKSAEEDYAKKKERQEAVLEGDKEDAARKMDEELEEMETLEARVKKLREKREELRRRGGIVKSNPPTIQATAMFSDTLDEEEEDEEGDDWYSWMKG